MTRIDNPFNLNIGGAEKLVVNGNGGNDTITGFLGSPTCSRSR